MRHNAGRRIDALRSFDVFINGPGLNDSMPGHFMTENVAIAKPERENGWNGTVKPRLGVAWGSHGGRMRVA
jgi:hypothetical protein